MTTHAATLTRALVRALTLVAALLATPALAAEPASDADEAARLFEEGRALFARGELERAVEAQRAAFALAPRFDIAGNLGQAELALGRHADATTHLAFALAHLPASTPSAARERLQRTFDEARAKVGALTIRVVPAEARVAVDGARVPLPLSAEQYVAPGTHLVTATLRGYADASARVAVAAGGTAPVALTLRAAAPAPPAGAPARPASEPPARDAAAPERPAGEPAGAGSSAKTIVTVASASLAVVALGAGVAFELGARSARRDASATRDDLERRFGASACAAPIEPAARAGCSALGERADDRERAVTAATVAFTAGGALALAAVGALTLWPSPAPGRAARLSLAPELGPRRATLGVAGHF